MNENMVAASYHPQNPKYPKYGQTVNVRPLTLEPWLNLDLTVYYNNDDGGNSDSQIYPY